MGEMTSSDVLARYQSSLQLLRGDEAEEWVRAVLSRAMKCEDDEHLQGLEVAVAEARNLLPDVPASHVTHLLGRYLDARLREMEPAKKGRATPKKRTTKPEPESQLVPGAR